MTQNKQIDLDKHLVIPIPEGMAKQQLALLVAQHFNYTPKIQNIENKTFTGNAEDFAELMDGKTIGKDYAVIETQPADNDETTVIYQEVTEIDNPVSAYDFGISQAIKPLGDLLRTIFLNIEKQKVDAQVKAIQNAAENKAKQAAALLDNIQAL